MTLAGNGHVADAVDAESNSRGCHGDWIGDVTWNELGAVPAGLEAEVGEPALGISATEGTELDVLTDRLTKLVETVAGTVAARQMVTHPQAAELTIADRALRDFMNSAATAPADVLAYLLGEAREAMQRLVGEHIAPDEILRNTSNHLGNLTRFALN
jgi:tRNA U34 5-carboxymethylaminomethyl modifying GTPase MnmE/TrmE